MIKRKKPAIWNRQLSGMYTVVLALAIIAHVSLFRQLLLKARLKMVQLFKAHGRCFGRSLQPDKQKT